MNKEKLLFTLYKNLSDDEVNFILFVLDLNSDDFIGSKKSQLTQLIDYLDHHNRLADLYKWLREHRPDIDIAGLASPTFESTPAEPVLQKTAAAEDKPRRSGLLHQWAETIAALASIAAIILGWLGFTQWPADSPEPTEIPQVQLVPDSSDVNESDIVGGSSGEEQSATAVVATPTAEVEAQPTELVATPTPEPASSVVYYRPTAEEVDELAWFFRELRFQDLKNPGDAYYQITVDENSTWIWSFSWCGESSEILATILPPLELSFAIDGEMVSESTFLRQTAELSNGWQCRTWHTALHEWDSSDVISLEIQYSHDVDVFDGSTTYPPGTYRHIIEVDIK